jgi:leader peptidase (prepilin peptidase)/N-methyltransferase
VIVASEVLVVMAGVFGSLLGSFLNVCVYRLPRNESVIQPPSHCRSCGAPVKWHDNIPVVSWLLLLGRCRGCGARVSVQYPLVELAVAFLWAGSVWWLGPSVDAIAAATFGTLLLGILLTDARHYIIPDEFSLGGMGLGLAFASFPSGMSLLGAAIGAAVGYGILWLVRAAGDMALARGWISGEAVTDTLGAEEPQTTMGGGDLKMMAMVGAFLGWRGVITTIFLGALVGTLVFLPFLFRKKRPLVAFGIYLAVGAAASRLVGDRLLSVVVNGWAQ